MYESNKQVMLADEALQTIFKMKQIEYNSETESQSLTEIDSDLSRISFYIQEFQQRLYIELSSPINKFWNFGQPSSKSHVKVNDKIFEYISNLSIQNQIEKTLKRVNNPLSALEDPVKLSSCKKKRYTSDQQDFESEYNWTLDELIYQKKIGNQSCYIDPEFRKDHFEVSTIYAKELQFWFINQYYELKQNQQPKQKVQGGIFANTAHKGIHSFWVIDENIQDKQRTIRQRHKISIKRKSSHSQIFKNAMGGDDNESCCTSFGIYRKNPNNKMMIEEQDFNTKNLELSNKTPIKAIACGHMNFGGSNFQTGSIKKSNRMNLEDSNSMMTPKLYKNKNAYKKLYGGSSSEGSKNYCESSWLKDRFRIEQQQKQEFFENSDNVSKNLFFASDQKHEVVFENQFFTTDFDGDDNFTIGEICEEKENEIVETASTDLTEFSNNSGSNNTDFFSFVLARYVNPLNQNSPNQKPLLMSKEEFSANNQKIDIKAKDMIRHVPKRVSESFFKDGKGSASKFCCDESFDNDSNQKAPGFDSLIKNTKNAGVCYSVANKRVKVNGIGRKSSSASSKQIGFVGIAKSLIKQESNVEGLESPVIKEKAEEEENTDSENF